ncbi:MAG: MFS transporter [Alphaproteobacteria bacterium]|nr:MFS transporter [Alphaproteobacteria bacterium]
MAASAQPERSEGLVIGLVGFAHLLSHFYQIALGPLFPLLRAEFDVSYTALGLIVTVFFGTSGVCQAFVGILVDRHGADRLLLFGVVAMSTSIFLMGLAPSYWVFLPLAVTAALGNSVFHPADLSILSAKVDPRRMGRAYAIHGFAGTSGYFLSPVVIFYGVVSFAGWRVGLMTAGVIGWFAAILLYKYRAVLRMPAGSVDSSGAMPGMAFYLRLITSLPLIAAFCYFALISGALIGMQNFSATVLVEIYNAPLYLATAGLTAYLGASAAGNLAGGEVADRLQRHAVIATTGLGLSAICMGAIAFLPLSVPVIIVLFGGVGFCGGATHASRDILVRAAAPAGATGKVFGFVYSGLDLGGALAPLLFGWLMDSGEYRGVFIAMTAMYLICIASVLQLKQGRAQIPAEAD